MAADKSSDRREFVRALISTRAKITRVDPEAVAIDPALAAPAPLDGVRTGPLGVGDGQPPPAWVDRIAEYLVKIDDKLDRILDKLEGKSRGASPRSTATAKDVSGSGIRLVVSEPVEKGEHLHISMNLPGFPLNLFQAHGKVVRVTARRGKDKGLFDVAVKFLYISEADREQLIAYSFQEQRKAIRASNGDDSV